MSETNARIYDIAEIRRFNLRALANQVGSITELARVINKSQSQVSQLIGKHPNKNIGNKIARHIENTFAKPAGWLDVLHEDVNDTLTAFELFEEIATHRPIPLLQWDEATSQISVQQLAQQATRYYMIPGNAKLSALSFALRMQDLENQYCDELKLPEHALVIIDPAQPLYVGAYIVLPHNEHKLLCIRQIAYENEQWIIRIFSSTTPSIQETIIINPEQIYGVIRQVMIEFP